MSWCTVESDPGVFTELIRNLGVSGVQVEELYDLNLEHLVSLQPVYGLIFLFKWEKEDVVEDGRQLLTDEAAHSHIFFARQIVQNACATQAIVSVLLNRPEVKLGAGLEAFKDFSMALPPEMRGEAIGNSEFIRKAHNAFARPEPFVFEEKKDDSGEGEDAFHFIGYVPVQGELYELDGLKPAPITLGKLSEAADWLPLAKQSIERRVQRYAEREIRFNLLALVRTPKDVYTERLADVRQRMQVAPSATLSSEESSLLSRIADEDAKQAKWRVENARRQHNYVPFIFNVLKLLAEKGKLSDVVEAAAKVTAERNARITASRLKKKEDKGKAKADTGKGAAPMVIDTPHNDSKPK